MKISILLILLLSCILTGCNSEEPIVIEEPAISTLADEYLYNSITFKAIGPKCGFREVNSNLAIHPFFNSDKHILVKRVLKSERDFWNTLLKSQSDKFIVTEADDYKVITTPTGVTYGYYPYDDTWSILVESVGLNSGYVRALMNQLCQLDS